MYWPNNVSNSGSSTDSGSHHQSQQYLTPPQSGNGGGYTDTYETALKDFNTAFRITTPYASPAHEVELSSSSESSVTEDKGSINWGSVLSLSSQSELDPLNNNSFVSEPWITPAVAAGEPPPPPPAGSTSPTSDDGSDDGSSNGSDDSGTGGHSFRESGGGGGGRGGGGDIGWKLSADDVIRAFPGEESHNVFSAAAAAASS